MTAEGVVVAEHVLTGLGVRKMAAPSTIRRLYGGGVVEMQDAGGV